MASESLNRRLREKLKQNKLIFNTWKKFYDRKIEKIEKSKITGDYKFINRSNNSENLCIVLAGYKELVWDDVFSRLKAFAPKDIDICVMSAGKYSETLNELCENNNWSYLSLEQNKVTLIQNITINLFPNAKYIYKIDEDIFITNGFFENLKNTYLKVERESRYKIGFVTPLIPINGYSYIKVLEKVNLIDDFDSKFGKAFFDATPGEEIINNPEIALYLWGNTKKELQNIDELSEKLGKEEFEYSICPIRFSIGAIMFPRKTWEDMGKFDVTFGNNLGLDEVKMCSFSNVQSRVIVVSHNNLVGHLGYGPQSKIMEEYYKNHREQFKLKI